MKKNGKKFGSDFAKIEAHVIQPHEYDELPMLTDEMVSQLVFKRNGKTIGRPTKANKKASVHLRLDPDVLAALRAKGKGWQTNLNNFLRAAVAEHRI